ncbi:MAG: enoyl-CoA hydratase/isomerase family protein [Actinomycetota bacterium]|jgi:enoyl-CoA hydratase/carnithine racemase|nr:enoyl-CoA hydratase/isomerase family protein [Euzebyaceae bacterium]MDQ3452526.1 enoyl-CoA hydratase/isomerase family protein [Actinomycetota bacterium]
MTVTFEVGEDHVGVVTLNRPAKLNAMDAAMFDGLTAAAAQAAAAIADRQCRAVVVTGAGRAFSAGLDVSLFAGQAAGHAPDDEAIAGMQQAFTAFEDLAVPTLAAVRGVALGAGCQLALACHLRVGATDADFGLLEARWGLIPDLGATWRLPRIVGLSRATDMAMTARRIAAPTALSWGLLDAVLGDAGEPGEFATAARTFAVRLARSPTVATGAVAGLMRGSFAAGREQALLAERQAQQRCLASADFVEAVRAGGQRRDAAFEGK